MDRYRGRIAALGTMHGKERAFGPPLLRRLSLRLVVPTLDTDALGSFSGEVERRGTARETVIAKARLAAETAGLPLGVASEGSFGPHPGLPWMPCGEELAAFVDLETGLTVVERRVGLRTTFSHVAAADLASAESFLDRIGFPAQAVLVRPESGAGPVAKGIRDRVALAAAIATAVGTGGLARIEADMRAHMNPMRMGEIRKVAARLARRLATPCPACGSSGYGAEEPVPGLPCGWCGTPTAVPMGIRHRCPACGHAEIRPGPGREATADPGRCPECNP